VPKLVAAKVLRSGRTARTWKDETERVDLDPGREGLRFTFSLASKGGGVTDVRLAVGTNDFRAVLTAMIGTDRGLAMREMAATLAAELVRQREIEIEIIQKGRQSVLEAARSAYMDAPDGRDHAERLTKDMVEALVSNLNAEDRAPTRRSGTP
jgi:hypothetical protein